MPYNPKKGQDQFASNWSKNFLPREWDFLNSQSGNYFAGLGSAFNALSPSNDPARLDQFRNQQIQSAARLGAMGGQNARWSGQGSGTQQSFQNAANMQALGNVGQFHQYQMSPEFQLQRTAALQGLFRPNLMLTSQEMSANRKGAHTPPNGGALGQIAGQLAGAYFGGAGGAMAGGMAGGGGGSPYSLGSGGYMNYQPASPMVWGSGMQLPVRY